jgi:hypothetical protein
MNKNKNLSRSGNANDFNNRASHSNTTSNRNKNVDNIEMIPIPDIDYDSDEEPEHQNEEEYDGDEENCMGPGDGLEMNPVLNRFRPNDYQINELLSRRPKQLTMRHARKIARQLGLLNQINSNLTNQGFEPDADCHHENSGSFSVPIDSKRRCWARKCDKPNCQIHDRIDFANHDNHDVEYHLFNNQVMSRYLTSFMNLLLNFLQLFYKFFFN